MKWQINKAWKVLVKLPFFGGDFNEHQGNVLKVLRVYKENEVGKRNANVKQKLILCWWGRKKYAKDVKVILWKQQHKLVVVDLNRRVLKKIMR